MAEDYAINWTAVVLAAAVGIVAVVLMFAMAAVLAPRRPSAAKAMPYESGIPPAPYSWAQLHIRYYIFAIFFLVFDVEAVFLFPWAVLFLKSPPPVFYEMLIFVAVLLFGIVYGWRKGALRWQ